MLLQHLALVNLVLRYTLEHLLRVKWRLELLLSRYDELILYPILRYKGGKLVCWLRSKVNPNRDNLDYLLILRYVGCILRVDRESLLIVLRHLRKVSLKLHAVHGVQIVHFILLNSDFTIFIIANENFLK